MIYKTETHKNILEFLRANKEKSFSAEEIFSNISKDGKGKSTVFRQLAKLSETSEIKRLVSSHNRSVRYQYVDKKHCGTHLHLKCSSCGKLIHLDNDFTVFFEKSIKSAKSFSIDVNTLIPGICEKCVAKEGAV